MRVVVGTISLLALLLPVAALAGNRAEVMMLPTRVVMGSDDRYATVVIKNVGQATGAGPGRRRAGEKPRFGVLRRWG